MRRLPTLGLALLLQLPGPAGAAFPGANGLIAFQTDRDGNDEIYVMNADGTGLRNLTNHPDDDREPQWSPDGRRIVFRRGDNGEEREIWVMNADGSGQARLTENGVEDEKPSWASDRTHVVFETDRDGEKQVYVMRRDGLSPENLSNDLSSAHKEPVWSPDGSRIAYQRNFDGDGDTREIWVMNPDGSGKTQLTDNDDEDEDPGWSPDGTRIVFESDRSGPKQLYVMNADGSGQTRLTTGSDDDVDPEWSPDGTQVVFVAGRHDNPEIYVMNADGSAQTRLTDWPGDDENPSWQPIPTTTTTTPPTTTTTLPGGGIPLAGRKLLLKDDAAKPSKRALKLVVKDAAIGTGSENGSSGDPVLHGGFLKLVSQAGDGFAASYDLPAASWRYQGKEGRNKGYKLKNAGPIRMAAVKLKKGAVTIVAKGEALGHALGADPTPVHVALGLGEARYCFTFGGTTKFTPGRKFTAKDAPASDSCVALAPVCGDQLLEEGESCPTLEGPPDGLAIDAVSNFLDPSPVPPSAVGLDGSGDPIVRTQYLLVFPEEATVAAVTAVIDGVGGRIAGMVSRVPSVLIEVPDPGSADAVEALIATLEADPAVTWVIKSHLSRPAALPPNYDLGALPAPDLSRLDHHLAVRAHAAWNARGAVQSSTLGGVVVEDWFGDGVPDGDFDVHTPFANDFAVGTTDPDGEHGYHVLGILAGTFGGDANGRGMVTGLATDTVVLRVIDRLSPLYIGKAAARIKAVITLTSGIGPHIFSTSLGYECGVDPVQLNRGAAWWIDMSRRLDFEDKVLHVTAAGNIESACPTDTDATTASDYAAASLAPVVDPTGTPLLGLSNTLVIENAVNTLAQPFAPACLSTGSKFPGQLAGIGTNVWSFRSSDPTGIGTAANVGDKSGTSMATPQVAGLAAYLWRLAPAMTVDELRRVLLVTSTESVGGPGVGTCAGPSAPVIDAYGAVLSLDEGVPPTPASAPIRLAVLDVDDDDDFDELDVFDHEATLFNGTTDAVEEPVAPKYERYDLNGDGWTGGADRRASFDLDRVGSLQYGASQVGEVTQVVEGVTVPFDERAVSDVDVLCYYAYSALYTGDAAQRTKLLGLKRCARIDMTVSFPSVIAPGIPETLLVSAGREGETGSVPVEDLHIQLSPAGGMAAPASGTTNASGEFQSQVSLDQGSTLVEIVVQALTAPGGEVLAEEVVTAAAPCLDQPTMLQLDYDTGEANPTYPGPVLQNGADYVVTASGTFSIWTGEWDNGVCKGAPDAGPGGPTGIDVEYWFAIPVGSALCGDFECCPNQHDNFRISTDAGGSFTDMEPLTPGYHPSHVYAYRVRGRGQAVHFQFEVPQPRGDDYGIVDVHIACDSDTTTTTTSTSTSSSTSSTTSSVTTTTNASSSTATSSSVSTTSSTSTTLFGIPVVPYARYDATGPDGPAVVLVDEFAGESVDLGDVILGLPPVTIDGVPPLDPNTHQTCYAHPGGSFDDCIDVQNVFGLAPVRIGDPVGVCVPELFPSIAVDAFKCYAAAGSSLDRPATLTDEFQTQVVTIGEPDLLCTPVGVDGAPLAVAGRYLVCYATAPAGAAAGQIDVTNAFHGPVQVDLGVATGVCVPAVRQLVATCQNCGNSVPEGDEECDDGNVAGGDGCSEVCRLEP